MSFQNFLVPAFWQKIVDYFSANYLNLLRFVATLFIGIVFIYVFLAVLKRIFKRKKVEPIAADFVLGTFKFLLWLVLILVLIALLGFNVNGIVTAVSALLLAVGMALKDNIANFASGLIIVSTKLYHKGDYIVVDGKEGKVDSIHFLFTILYANDKQKIIIPNSKITTESVVNVFANDTRRVTYSFRVARESDVELVKETVIHTMANSPAVLSDPAPFCALDSVGKDDIAFFATCWCKQENYWDVYFAVNERVYDEFKKVGISIPYGQLEVRMRTDNVKLPIANYDDSEK